MNETDLLAFTNVVTDYFLSVTGVPAAIGLPYIKGEHPETFAYTGVIGISGTRRGGIYLTADKALLKAFGKVILDGEDLDDDALYDLVGEMSNTIAGNIREVFGSGFLISVPIILKGQISDIVLQLRPPVFVIPIEWNGQTCRLAIGLE